MMKRLPTSTTERADHLAESRVFSERKLAIVVIQRIVLLPHRRHLLDVTLQATVQQELPLLIDGLLFGLGTEPNWLFDGLAIRVVGASHEHVVHVRKKRLARTGDVGVRRAVRGQSIELFAALRRHIVDGLTRHTRDALRVSGHRESGGSLRLHHVRDFRGGDLDRRRVVRNSGATGRHHESHHGSHHELNRLHGCSPRSLSERTPVSRGISADKTTIIR